MHIILIIKSIITCLNQSLDLSRASGRSEKLIYVPVDTQREHSQYPRKNIKYSKPTYF